MEPPDHPLSTITSDRLPFHSRLSAGPWDTPAPERRFPSSIYSLTPFVPLETKGKTLEEVDALFDGTVHFEVGGVENGVVVIEGLSLLGSYGRGLKRVWLVVRRIPSYGLV